MQELWAAIPGFEGYQVSNLGGLRSFRALGSCKCLLDVPRVLKPNKCRAHSRAEYRLCTPLIRPLGAPEGGKRFKFKVHRLVYELFVGPIPVGYEIDHRDRNPLNNCVSNLRLATRQQNNGNSRMKRKGEGYKGVWFDKKTKSRGKPYSAEIKIDGKKIYLGRYFTALEAAQVYNAAAIKHFGDFAYLNDLSTQEVTQ